MAPKFILIVTYNISMSDSEMNRPKVFIVAFYYLSDLAHRIIQDSFFF
jgi:hypothetical protein